MAKKKTSRTAFTNKLKKRAGAGWKGARTKAAKKKGQRIPGGIVNGIAKLTVADADLDKKGNPYFRFGGEVVSPAEFYGVPATVFHGIAETKTKTVDDKLEGLSSDCQLLGIETDELDLGEIAGALEELKDEGETYFLFNTWQPDADRDAFVFIQGLADEEAVEEALDEAGADSEVVEDDEEPEDDDAPEDEEGDDDEEPEDEEEPEEPEDDADEWEPEVDEVYAYKPPRKRKAVEVTVKAVQKKARTVALEAEDGTKYTKVSWDKLEDAE